MSKGRLTPSQRRQIIKAYENGELDTDRYEVIPQPKKGAYYIKQLEPKKKAQTQPNKNNIQQPPKKKQPEPDPEPEPEPKINANNGPDPNDEEDIYEPPEGLNNVNPDYNPFNDPRVFFPMNKMTKRDLQNNYQWLINQMFYEQLKSIRKEQKREIKKRNKIGDKTKALYKTVVEGLNEVEPPPEPTEQPTPTNTQTNTQITTPNNTAQTNPTNNTTPNQPQITTPNNTPHSIPFNSANVASSPLTHIPQPHEIIQTPIINTEQKALEEVQPQLQINNNNLNTMAYAFRQRSFSPS